MGADNAVGVGAVGAGGVVVLFGVYAAAACCCLALFVAIHWLAGMPSISPSFLTGAAGAVVGTGEAARADTNCGFGCGVPVLGANPPVITLFIVAVELLVGGATGVTAAGGVGAGGVRDAGGARPGAGWGVTVAGAGVGAGAG